MSFFYNIIDGINKYFSNRKIIMVVKNIAGGIIVSYEFDISIFNAFVSELDINDNMTNISYIDYGHILGIEIRMNESTIRNNIKLLHYKYKKYSK